MNSAALRTSCSICHRVSVAVQRRSLGLSVGWLLGGGGGHPPDGVTLCRAEPDCDGLACEAPLMRDDAHADSQKELTRNVGEIFQSALENDPQLRAMLSGVVLDWAAANVFLPLTTRIEFSPAVLHAVLVTNNYFAQYVESSVTVPSVAQNKASRGRANAPSAIALQTAVKERSLLPCDLIIIRHLAAGADRVTTHFRAMEALDFLGDAASLFGNKCVGAGEAADWLQRLNSQPGGELVIPWIVREAVRLAASDEQALLRFAAVGEALVGLDREGFGVEVAGQMLASLLQELPTQRLSEGEHAERVWGMYSLEVDGRDPDSGQNFRLSVPRWLAACFAKATMIRSRDGAWNEREIRFARRAVIAARLLVGRPAFSSIAWHFLVVRCVESLWPSDFPRGTGLAVEDLKRRVKQTTEDFAQNKDAKALVERCNEVLVKVKYKDTTPYVSKVAVLPKSVPSALDRHLQEIFANSPRATVPALWGERVPDKEEGKLADPQPAEVQTRPAPAPKPTQAPLHKPPPKANPPPTQFREKKRKRRH